MDDGTANFLATSPCSMQEHTSAMPATLPVSSYPMAINKAQQQQQQQQQQKQKRKQQLSSTVSSSGDEGGVAAAPSRMELSGGIGMIPHPEKAHRGGEDAFFLTRTAMGVADGVGSWSLQGIDAGLFARSLMIESRRGTDAGMRHPGKIMERAHNATKMRGLKGSSTALVLVLEGDQLRSANLGDSGFMVIRQGEILFRSKEQTHAFNTPYQIGHETSGGDRPTAADLHTLTVRHGDIIVAGTDGLFDNLYETQIVSMVTSSVSLATTHTSTTSTASSTTHTPLTEEEITEKLQVLAEHIVNEAHIVAGRKTGRVPFGDAAAKHGMSWYGGKMDDITICISAVRDPSVTLELITPTTTTSSTTNPSDVPAKL
eukprot:TRINITY_DN1679_c4_g1_i1.p1 TRINITY_DN1679_c4_g1~~TRINITY_DN1679_c4_g1_i1.p1  ORF type:complete len:372 (-),score=98.60 TRINITY_DN1679_c4_g1_i1:66-1181(-)